MLALPDDLEQALASACRVGLPRANQAAMHWMPVVPALRGQDRQLHYVAKCVVGTDAPTQEPHWEEEGG